MLEQPPFSAGRVLGRGVGICLGNFVPFTVLTLICHSPLLLYAAYFIDRGAFAEDDTRQFTLIYTLATLLLSPLAAGAVTFGVVQQLRGQRASVGQCIRVGLARTLPVLGVGLVSGLWIVLGVLALVVPGIIVGCALWVAVPVAVVERPGVSASLKRSGDLTRGRRWSVFAVLLTMTLVGIGIDWVSRILLLEDAPSVADVRRYLWVATSATLLVGALRSVTEAVGYHDLRRAKEGVDAEQLARVFD